jgi:N-acetyl-S-(2-succino)cysteine monooxygenase
MSLIVFFLSGGRQRGAWRLPNSRSGDVNSLAFVTEFARRAEGAKLDAVFMGDSVAATSLEFRQPPFQPLEPLTTLGSLAAVTDRIGLISTASTTFTEPYNLARYFASLDHLSSGRAGWNIVTSFAGDENFSVDLPPHDERYARAYEYLDVVTSLWDSWRDDAIVNDKDNGVWAIPDRIRPINFKGKYYSVAGPLNVARPPQGWPVLLQAGSSRAGMDFAAAWADVVFTAQATLDLAQSFYADVKARALNSGRDPDKVKVFPGIIPIIGDSEREARRLADELCDLIDIDAGRAALQRQLGPIPLDGLDLDQPIPSDLLVSPEEFHGTQTKYKDTYSLTAQGMTLREILKSNALSSDQLLVIGTAEQVAGRMQEYFTEGGCDGFNIEPSHLMDGLTAVTDELIPILQERGLFRKDYEGATLRDHLGLDRPA